MVRRGERGRGDVQKGLFGRAKKLESNPSIIEVQDQDRIRISILHTAVTLSCWEA